MMLALEHSRRQQFADQGYDLEHSIHAPYPGLTMDAYDSVDPMVNFHPLPYSYFENPSIFTTAPIQSIKQEMHQLHELPPALISSGSAPSIPSASSSTVGSPYSGPSHTISSQDGYDHSGVAYGLGVMPTIVNHDVFSQDLLGASMETELSLTGHDKLSDSFVGESSNLSSSQNQHSTVELPDALPSSCHASPKLLSLDTVFDSGASTASPARSNSVFSSVVHSPSTEQTRATPAFKSPTTPASARSRQSSVLVSPARARQFPPSRSHLGPTSSIHMLPHDPNATQHSHVQRPVSRFQSHFFAQSSGNFIPPLESSCSSLPHVFFFLPP